MGGSSWLGCALSNGEIQVYDQNNLHALQTYHHSSLVTDLVRDVSDPNALVASAADGTVVLYDIRQGHQPTYKVKLPRIEEEALSVAVGFEGNVMAVGSNKAKIHFFDVRGGQGLLGTYNQAHTNEITRVRFQNLAGSLGTTPTTSSLLVSGAEDGLACIYDTSQASEEAAIQNVLSVQSPIREVDFFGPQAEAVYCLTGSESLMLYHKDDSVCRKDFGPGLRDQLSQQVYTAMTSINPSPTAPMPPKMEYLVDCHWDASKQELQLLAGSAHGEAAVFSVGEGGVNLTHALQGGHRGVVRAWQALSSGVFVTVGEDARMCEWNRLSGQLKSFSNHGTSSGSTCSRGGGRKPPEVLLAPSARNRQKGGPRLRQGGGKMRRPRSRMTATPY